jgi:3-oxoacyl-[acyl-carrier protein] reductase
MVASHWEVTVPWNRLLEGRVAIVTGGGRGIGAETAGALSRAGAAVTLAARNTAEIDRVAEQLRTDDEDVLAVPTDITDSKQVENMVDRTIDRFGRVDYLINCAGTIEPLGKPSWEITKEDWRQAIEVNLLGAFGVCSAVVPHMIRQGTGRLIMVSSSLGERVFPRASAYCASRAGVNHFTRVLAAELLGSGVTANIVLPGIVDTETLHQFRVNLFDENRARQPIVRARHPSDPARLILWLCSPGTARMTGQIVSLDDPMVQRRMSRFR